MSRSLSIIGMGSPLNMSAFLTAPRSSPRGERGLVSASFIIDRNSIHRGPGNRSFTPAITRVWPTGSCCGHARAVLCTRPPGQRVLVVF